MDLKWITQMTERVHELEEENKHLKGLLEECENKREPDMTKPQPCTKYRDAERMAWIAKLVEETHEVVQEAQIVAQLEKADEEALSTVLWEARKRLAMELTDVKPFANRGFTQRGGTRKSAASGSER
jgi:hypothetical protein